MGLDTTHDCWHGPYSSFGEWRKAICEAAGLGDLNDFCGFGGDLPFPEGDPIVHLLDHSDCDGEILHDHCAPLADALEKLLPNLDGDYNQRKARLFIAGLRTAHEAGENVEFH